MIDDIQTNFGEIINPAPAAFSPQFTRKHYRASNGDGSDSNGTIPPAHYDYSSTSSHGSHHQSVRPKTVFIPIIATVDDDRDVCEENTNNDHNTRETSAGNSNDHNGHYNDKSKFLNKRAVHYNEYKVLQAMRAKMKAEEDEEDDDNDEY